MESTRTNSNFMDFCKFKANITRLKLITVDTNTSKTQKETERHTHTETKKRERDRETEKVHVQCSQQVNKATWVCKNITNITNEYLSRLKVYNYYLDYDKIHEQTILTSILYHSKKSPSKKTKRVLSRTRYDGTNKREVENNKLVFLKQDKRERNGERET